MCLCMCMCMCMCMCRCLGSTAGVVVFLTWGPTGGLGVQQECWFSLHGGGK